VGIVSVVVVFGSFALLAVLTFKMNAMREEQESAEIAWWMKLATAIGMFGLLVGGVGIYNSFFQKIETPFDPPAADLPPVPAEVAEPEPPAIEKPEQSDPVGDAKDEHRDALDEFEKRNSP
jgi:hypothetical protein